jgi:hypothetical protein
MRVEQRETFAIRDVLASEIQDQGRFARSGLADDVRVSAAIRAPDAKAPAMIAEIGLAQTGDFLHHFSVSIV